MENELIVIGDKEYIKEEVDEILLHNFGEVFDYERYCNDYNYENEIDYKIRSI